MTASSLYTQSKTSHYYSRVFPLKNISEEMTTLDIRFLESNSETISSQEIEIYYPYQQVFKLLSTRSVMSDIDMLAPQSIDKSLLSIIELWRWINNRFAPTGLRNLEENVLELFAQITAVEAIYKEISERAIIFFVFTSNEKYDDQLMDDLLSIEGSLLDQYHYPGWDIIFRYIPAILCDNMNEITSKNATLIFER